MDKIEEELKKEKQRRESIHNDLKRLGAELGAPAQVALIVELTRIDNHIRDIEKELSDMKFDDIVSDYFKEDK